MRTTTAVVAALLVSGLLAACSSGPARPQVEEIADSNGTRVMMTYEADRLKTVKIVDRNGSVSSEAVASYEGALLNSLSVTESSETPIVYDYTYDEAGLLTKIAAASGNWTYSNTFSYVNGLLARTVVSDFSGNLGSTTTTEYEYVNGTTQIERTSETEVGSFGSFSVTSHSVSAYTYDESNLLESIQVTDDNNNPTLYEFSYDEARRLEKVARGTNTYTLEYGEDGLVKRTNYQSGDNSSWSTYTYGTGAVSGIVANPLVSFGSKFDLAGVALPTDQVFVTSSLMGLGN